MAAVSQGFRTSFVVAARYLRDPARGVAGDLGCPLSALALGKQPDDLDVSALYGIFGPTLARSEFFDGQVIFELHRS